MSEIENSMTTVVDELSEIKQKIVNDIAVVKHKLSMQKKELTKLEKLQLELNPDKPDRIKLKEQEINKLIEQKAELDGDLESLKIKVIDLLKELGL